MTRAQRAKYEDTEALRDILNRVLAGRKFLLDCGHHVTFGTNLGNDITIRNGKKLKIICSQCSY